MIHIHVHDEQETYVVFVTMPLSNVTIKCVFSMDGANT